MKINYVTDFLVFISIVEWLCIRLKKSTFWNDLKDVGNATYIPPWQLLFWEIKQTNWSELGEYNDKEIDKLLEPQHPFKVEFI